MAFWIRCVICAGAIVVLGGWSGWVTASSIGGWYEGLAKPPGTPPNAVFGPVWTVLYVAMGVALARVLHFVPRGLAKRRALVWFGIQLALNLAWTPVFFGARHPGAALLVIVALLVSIVLTIRAFRPLDRPAAWLLVPYLLWVTYASYLNAGFLFLNR